MKSSEIMAWVSALGGSTILSAWVTHVLSRNKDKRKDAVEELGTLWERMGVLEEKIDKQSTDIHNLNIRLEQAEGEKVKLETQCFFLNQRIAQQDLLIEEFKQNEIIFKTQLSAAELERTKLVTQLEHAREKLQTAMNSYEEGGTVPATLFQEALDEITGHY